MSLLIYKMMRGWFMNDEIYKKKRVNVLASSHVFRTGQYTCSTTPQFISTFITMSL